MGRPRYLFESVLGTFSRKRSRCPSCDGAGGQALDRKYLVTALRRCNECHLLFRTPTTLAMESERFYKSSYRQGATTELPSKDQLRDLKADNFESLSASYQKYIEVLVGLGAKPGQRILDFGCSWGYGSYQLRNAGFEVRSFDVSANRMAFAEEYLSIPTLPRVEDIQAESFDIFFSAHVIEHVPSVVDMVQLGLRSIGPGGLFVVFTPNGSQAYRQLQPGLWHRSWGEVHPQLLDDCYLQRLGFAHLAASSSGRYALEELRSWAGEERVLRMDGAELLLAARKR